eukprot:6775831-Alexandrium_andersonii.AAC.1
MRSCLRSSELDLRRLRNGLSIDPRSSGGVRSAAFVRADAKLDDAAGERARRRRLSEGGGPLSLEI